MKVLMVTSSYPLFPGDVTAPFIEEIAQAVIARGHQVDVLLPHHPKLARPADDAVRFFPYRYAPDAWSVWGYAQSLAADVRVRGGVYLLAPLVALSLRRALRTRLRAERYDVAQVHWVVPNAALVSDVLRAARVPYVVSCHGSDVFLAERLLPARALARRAFVNAGSVTACSGDLHQRALALGAAATHTHTVPYGVDTAAFGKSVDVGAVRARLGVPEGVLFVLAFGRLVEKKGFPVLVEAVAGMPGVHVAIAGAGDLQDVLQREISQRGAPVHLVGALDRDAIAQALAAADVVVVPSVIDSAGNVDGLPNSLLEALAAGCAVVASQVAGIPEVVSDGSNGLLVAPGDASALRAALARLAANPALRQDLGQAARARAQRELTWSAIAQRFEECYAEATALAPR
jgi:glycosyltransferase involved in cell wall biosynthesis